MNSVNWNTTWYNVLGIRDLNLHSCLPIKGVSNFLFYNAIKTDIESEMRMDFVL